VDKNLVRSVVGKRRSDVWETVVVSNWAWCKLPNCLPVIWSCKAFLYYESTVVRIQFTKKLVAHAGSQVFNHCNSDFIFVCVHIKRYHVVSLELRPRGLTR